jgi:hypothetical protein
MKVMKKFEAKVLRVTRENDEIWRKSIEGDDWKWRKKSEAISMEVSQAPWVHSY